MLRFAAVFALAFTLMLQPAGAQTPLTPVQFRDAVIAAVLELEPDAVVRADSDVGFTVRRPNAGDTQSVNLEFPYERYLRDPTQLNVVVAQWARLGLNGPEIARFPDRIVSILRPRSFVQEYQRALARAELPAQLVTRPFAGDLLEVMVFDSPETVEFITEQSLSEIGITPERGWALAPQNLLQRMGAMLSDPISDGAVIVSSENGLGPSALTDPATCAAPDAANYIFLVIERNAFLRVDRTGELGRSVAGFRDVLVRDGETMSGTLLECRDGRVQEVGRAARGAKN